MNAQHTYCFCYVVNITKEEGGTGIKKTDLQALNFIFKKPIWQLKKEDSEEIYLVFMPSKSNEDSAEPVKLLSEVINNIPEQTRQNFSGIYFGIHGSDLGIKSTKYDEKDANVIEDINDIDDIKSSVKDFISSLKKDKCTDSVVKVFSRSEKSSIWKKMSANFKNFCTFEAQDEIFGITKRKNRLSGEGSVKSVGAGDEFATTLNADDPDTRSNKLNQLEVLFFEFRVCLAALDAYCSTKEKKADKETSGTEDMKKLYSRILFLLNGGALKKDWIETVVLSKCKKPAESNHFTEECKILGIGNYIYMLKGGTDQILTLIRELCGLCADAGSRPDNCQDNISQLKAIEKKIKGLIQSEREHL